MTNQEILDKAIQKAIDGGWKLWDKLDHYFECGKCKSEAAFTAYNGKYHDEDGGKWHEKTRLPVLFEDQGDWLLGWTNEKGEFDANRLSELDIIFNHDFARALWGESEPKPPKVTHDVKVMRIPLPDGTVSEHRFDAGSIAYDLTPSGYKHHLQQMVLADDPIKYLGDNL